MTPRRRPELRITGMLAAVTLASVLSTSMATVAEDTAPRSARADTDATDTSPRGSATEIRTAIEAARASMASEDWAKAADAWSEVERLDPTAAAAIYNLGVARYRDGDPQAAADAFERAARFGDADLAARSMYNEGTARYAAALEQLGDDTEASDPKAMQETIERVERSLEHFKDALDADQENRDARINAELAARLIRRLEEVQQQQEQQQQGQQQQDQQQQDQQQQDQQQQDQQQQDQQQQDQQQEDQEEQDQQKDSEQEDDAEATPSSSEASDDAEASEPRMTREEPERLLQSVRDKERQRRREKAEAEERRPKKPVE
ncbi:MAG: hypothetical protein GY885_01260, partial [Phycisphaeraceae bacterium]|nr:hypothetical protein [Phycisphaeraceae bacterium]